MEYSLNYCLTGGGEPHNPLSCETSRRRGPAHGLHRAAVPNSGKGDETLWVLNLFQLGHLFNLMILPAAAGQLSGGRAEREVHRQDRERLLAERRREDAHQAPGQDARALGGALQQLDQLR